jgi:hypothetical protein
MVVSKIDVTEGRNKTFVYPSTGRVVLNAGGRDVVVTSICVDCPGKVGGIGEPENVFIKPVYPSLGTNLEYLGYLQELREVRRRDEEIRAAQAEPKEVLRDKKKPRDPNKIDGNWSMKRLKEEDD